MTIKEVLFEILDNLPPGNISGWELYHLVNKTSGRCPYPSTLLEMAREYADISGADFHVVDRKRSIYFFKPFIKISGAIIWGKE